MRGEDEGGDEERGLALGKLCDDAKLVVVGSGVGWSGFAGRVVVPGGAGRGGGGRVVRGVFGGVDEGVPLRARGENRQHQHQRRTRQRGEAREERERGGAARHGGDSERMEISRVVKHGAGDG